MKEHGLDVYHYEGNEYSDKLARILDDISPDHIVFPILQMEGTIPLDKIKKSAILYPGVAAKDWLAPFTEADISHPPLFKGSGIRLGECSFDSRRIFAGILFFGKTPYFRRTFLYCLVSGKSGK